MADFGSFIDHFLKFENIVERTTINLNYYDNVLKISAIQNGVSRHGRPDLKELTGGEDKAIANALQRDKLEIINADNLVKRSFEVPDG